MSLDAQTIGNPRSDSLPAPVAAEDSAFTRHGTYFFEDGNITFLVDNTLFCVHRYFFARDSSHFAKRLVRLGARENEALEATISLRDVKRADFEAFLSILYPAEFDEHSRSYEQWKGVLHLSTLWDFTSVRRLALASLKPPTPFDQLLLGRAYSVEHYIVPAMSSLCERPEPLTLGEVRQMRPEDVVLVASVRESIRGAALEIEPSDIPASVQVALSHLHGPHADDGVLSYTLRTARKGAEADEHLVRERAANEAHAKTQTESRQRVEAEVRAHEAEDAKAWAEAEANANAEAEVQAQAQAETKARAEAKEEAGVSARAYAEAKAKVEVEAKAFADAKRAKKEATKKATAAKAKHKEAKAMAEKAKIKAGAEAKAKAEAEEQARREAEAKAAKATSAATFTQCESGEVRPTKLEKAACTNAGPAKAVASISAKVIDKVLVQAIGQLAEASAGKSEPTQTPAANAGESAEPAVAPQPPNAPANVAKSTEPAQAAPESQPSKDDPLATSQPPPVPEKRGVSATTDAAPVTDQQAPLALEDESAVSQPSANVAQATETPAPQLTGGTTPPAPDAADAKAGRSASIPVLRLNHIRMESGWGPSTPADDVASGSEYAEQSGTKQSLENQKKKSKK
ncbi:hypothetical protein BC834DRAFT_958893 [Gloeopeniophorella convolvens]|nr:hypothetical protein BC834DRAFT_958893 [Gloeopeniophorella convolvens]